MKRLMFATMASVAFLAVADEKIMDIRPGEAKIGDAPAAEKWQADNAAVLAAATDDGALDAIASDKAKAKALLAQLRGAYLTDPTVAFQVGAISQRVMRAPDAERRIWTEALLSALEKSRDSYVKQFCIDQLRWCAYRSQAEKVRRLGKSANDAHVAKLADMAAAEIARAPECDEEGFTPLFNGKDTTGWYGSTYFIVKPEEPGVLQYTDVKGGKGRNFMTKKEYGDFILRFEFTMPPNGNNGVGIRAPVDKDDPFKFIDSAYHGMCELQLLDDGGSSYYDAAAQKDKLAKYQYTGSIYGIVPSRRDCTRADSSGGGSYVRKPGMWNYEEVKVVGSTIEVRLNGVLITKGDVSKFKGDGTDTPDHAPHPGLHNKRGHIGFLGHGFGVKWRNIRIKEL